MVKTQTQQATKVRSGMYEVRIGDTTWTIVQRPVDPGYGGGWAWFASADNGAVLDPLPTLARAKAAVLSC